MARSVAERLQDIEQQKARIAQQEAKLKLDARKARDRRLYAAGGLVEKAGLLELDTNALYGALLSLKDAALEKPQVEQWAAVGGRSFAREARLRDEGKEPFTLTFPSPLAKEVTASLRAAGFRFSTVLKHWEGMARPDDAEALVRPHGGTVRRINPSADAAPNPSGRPGEDEGAGDNGAGHDGDLLSRGRSG